MDKARHICNSDRQNSGSYEKLKSPKKSSESTGVFGRVRQAWNNAPAFSNITKYVTSSYR